MGAGIQHHQHGEKTHQQQLDQAIGSTSCNTEKLGADRLDFVPADLRRQAGLKTLQTGITGHQ